MSRSPFLPRRWVVGAVVLGAMSMWSSGPKSALRSENGCERVRQKLVSLLHEPERARKLGRVYLRSRPGRLARPLELAETVLAEIGPERGSEAIRRLVVARIRRELQNAQVISLDGWIMSPTEARLCGLAAADGTL
jgi:hypothetical protein